MSHELLNLSLWQQLLLRLPAQTVSSLEQVDWFSHGSLNYAELDCSLSALPLSNTVEWNYQSPCQLKNHLNLHQEGARFPLLLQAASEASDHYQRVEEHNSGKMQSLSWSLCCKMTSI
uniref:Uncharacterized protein n=1 Tax=Opuntia streptacantha TaxID=393608 RepID=A0A7C9D7M4_OPUST